MDYPELYYRTYPKVVNVVEDYLETKPEVEEITQEEMDEMIDEIYMEVVKEYPEIHEDIQERRINTKKYKRQIREFYGRSRIFKDLIAILLISELLRKNRTFYPI
jgi:hypothetical protein